MQPEDRIRVVHMVEAADSVARFVAGRSRHDLDRDEMLLFAMVRAIEIIGEAAGRVSSEARAVAPEIPWPAIVGMRNRLIHGYADIDRDILWKAATEEVPTLSTLLRALVGRSA